MRRARNQFPCSKTGLPLPLGGNVIRKDITPADRSAINRVLYESIRYGLEHRAIGVAHARPLARGLDTALADQFIGMYVNELTLDYGDTGRRAIREFLAQAHAARLIPAPVELELVEYGRALKPSRRLARSERKPHRHPERSGGFAERSRRTSWSRRGRRRRLVVVE